MVFTGNNTYTGVTTISAGGLQLGDGGTTGSVGGNVVNNAELAFNRSDAYTYGNVISGTGFVVQYGAGVLTLSGKNTYTGQTQVWAGSTLNVTGSLAKKDSKSIQVTALEAGSTGSAATIIRKITSGTALAGYGATGNGNLTTEAQMLGGVTTSDSNLSMSWRDATTTELGVGKGTGFISEVLNLSGLNAARYGLSLTFDTDALANLGAGTSTGGVYVAWSADGSTNWEKVSLGSASSSYSDSLAAGSWGLTGTNTIWVVTDHTNGSFVVVPEPGTLALLSVALLSLAAYVWRRNK